VNSARERHAVLVFFVLSYAISWGAALLLEIIARSAGLEHFGALMRMAESTFDFSPVEGRLPVPVPVAWTLTRVVDFGPTLGGLATALYVGGTSELRRLVGRLFKWRVGISWYALALIGPAALMLLAIGLYAPTNPAAATPEFAGLTTLRALGLWLSVRIILGGGMGEELGWRGFALDRMLRTQSANQASLTIGLVWTFWHLPGHIFGDFAVGNIIGQLLITVPMSYVATWMYLRTGGSVLILTLFHGATNGFLTFFERSLFPGLRDADGWQLVFLLFVLAAAVLAAGALSKNEARRRGEGMGE
jgi:membrane protease YdiL (CAAX protease family)